MSTEKYNENYINKIILEQEEYTIDYEDIVNQRHVLSNGSTFKCHINEIDSTKSDIIDSSFNEEDESEV